MSNTAILGVVAMLMALLWYLEIRTTNKLKKQLSEEREERFKESVKTYKCKFKFINIENAGDNDTLNRTAEMYHNEGYNLDREKSTDRLLVFVKREEVKKD